MLFEFTLRNGFNNLIFIFEYSELMARVENWHVWITDQLPLNDLLRFMGRMEAIIRHQQADDLLNGIE